MNNIKEARPIYYSARIRLNEDQRQQLKDAYQAVRTSETPSAPASIGGSAIQVQTAYSYQASHGLSDITMRDLLSTRESISVGVVLKIQAVLGVEVISRKDLEKEFKEYLDYIMSDTYASK